MKPLFSRHHSQAGFSLVDALVALGVTVAALAGFGAAAQQATVLARSGKAFASAGQLLQQRTESFRRCTTWANVTTAAGIASLTPAPFENATTFSNFTEIFTVQPYPSGTALVITRSPTGAFSNNGVTLPTTTLVKLTITTTWTVTGNKQRSRQVSTLIAKGGI